MDLRDKTFSKKSAMFYKRQYLKQKINWEKNNSSQLWIKVSLAKIVKV
jgi:hypothetical protein